MSKAKHKAAPATTENTTTIEGTPLARFPLGTSAAMVTKKEIAETFETVPATAATRLALLARGPSTLIARGGNARILKTDGGRLVTHGEVVAGLLARAEIEAEVVDGARPEWVSCSVCKAPVRVPPGGALPSKCAVHMGHACMECGRARRGKGRPGMCAGCAKRTGKWSDILRKRNAALTPAQRSENARKAQASMTSEQRSAARRKGMASMTPDQRSEAARKGKTSMTSEQRSEAIRKGRASMTPEQRSAAARKWIASKTPEQRSEARHKAWATRRAKKLSSK